MIRLTLRKEDYREAPFPWLAKLFLQLNTFFEGVTAALTKGLVRGIHLRSVVKELQFTNTAADGFALSGVRHDLGQRPTDVWVGHLRRTDGAPIDEVWSFTWELDAAGDLSVRFRGLAGSVTYAARLLIE